MIQDDLETKICIEENDPVTRLMLEEILADEENHEYDWRTLLAGD